MSNELVPEIHDIGKLANIKHNFEDYDLTDKRIKLDTKTWQGVLGHHCHEHFSIYPTTPETFILCIADNISASVSRHLEIKGKSVFQVYKLWNPTKEGDIRLKEQEDILELLEFLATDPSKDEYFQRYGELLRLRAEDSHPGKNITTLYTHSKLTGQFYRILKGLPSPSESEFSGKQREDVDRMVKVFQNRSKLTIAKCKFCFCQKPIRVRDLNIFKIMEDLVNNIKKSYPDNVLFGTSDEVLLVSPNLDLLETISEMAFKYGLRIEVDSATCNLDELKPDPTNIPRAKREIRYFDLSESIEPPICEICQMAKATKRWPADYTIETEEEDLFEEGIEEYLCQICFSLREKGIRLKKLKKWSEEVKTKVIWIRLRLEFDQLIKALKDLYFDYLRQFNSDIPKDKCEVRFSLVSEFQEDYNVFLRQFQDNLTITFREENIEEIMSDLFCLKVEKFSDILKILEIYKNLLSNFFSKFKEMVFSPLKFIAVCSNSKFPFFEVWRIIDGKVDDINISLIGHGEVRTNNMALDQMLFFSDTSKIRKSALYKLADIAKLSQKLAQLTFEDRFEQDHKTYSKLKNILPMGMDFQSILTFAQLIGD